MVAEARRWIGVACSAFVAWLHARPEESYALTPTLEARRSSLPPVVVADGPDSAGRLEPVAPPQPAFQVPPFQSTSMAAFDQAMRQAQPGLYDVHGTPLPLQQELEAQRRLIA